MTDATSAAPVDRFVHLHLHTEYSLLDGGNRVEALMAHVAGAGMHSVAITDHGNLHGVVEFYNAARKTGIKPILGIEAYVAPGRRTDRTYTGVADGGFHLVLLAENNEGWANLVKLSSDAFLNGFYFKPRMDKTTLAQRSAGLIAINGHLGSSIAHHLLRYVQSGEKEEHFEAALEEARWHAETFGVNDRGEPCFYIELQKNGVVEQDSINPHLVRVARELNVPIVCDNDAHFMRAEDHDTHDTLICISMGKQKTETSRLHYPRELHVKTPDEMIALFADYPEAIENTVKIAQRCHVQLPEGENHAPVVLPVIPDELPTYESGDRTQWYKEFCSRFELRPFDAQQQSDLDRDELHAQCDAALRQLCEAGLIWRYGPEGITDEIRARLERELTVLSDKGISAYFLIVWDFVSWARLNDIYAVARGSGVGTMVGYVLGLSNACPVRYGLLFERFTDPDRSEYPDIDIDICQNGRSAVIEYVRRKYGHVAQIITFGTLKARAAIKDVGRVLGFSPGETQRLANLVPEGPKVSLDDALHSEPDLKEEYETNPKVHELIETALALEGQVRHSGVHAAGVVIATQPLDDIIPLCKPTGANASEDDALTQWDGPTVEKFGLLKMDFLGLRTISTVERCKALIRESIPTEKIREILGIADPSRDPLDLDRLDCTDPRVFALFQRADTAGVFQFESGGMRKLLMEMKPDRLEDLIAANALYRPGPMELIPDYNRRKHGRETVPRVHPIVDRLTAETYGIMVYQEQVMQICHELGGIPLRAAYTLIKAISKKNEKVINKERERFVEGAASQGLEGRKANELYDLILKFAGYGFNKSHSTGYAIVAYQTAYLKVNFPNQYMAAMLTFESQAQKVSNWIGYLDDCRHVEFPDGHTGIDVKPPDINLSASDFSVVYLDGEERDQNHGHVRFGLQALKGAGQKAVGAIVDERVRHGAFKSFYDFCERVPLNVVNKATIEALIKAGAFDSVHGRDHRAAMVEAIEPAVRAGQAAAADRAAGQNMLFGGGGGEGDAAAGAKVSSARADETPLPRVTPWSMRDSLMHEKEVLGFFISSHPIEQWKGHISKFGTATTQDAADLGDRTPVRLGGMLTRIRPLMVRRGQSAGQKMAMITVEDQFGQIDGVIFSDAYAQYGHLLTDHAMLFLIGAIDRSQGGTALKVDKVIAMEDAPAQLAGSLEIRVRDGEDADATLNMLTGELTRSARLNGAQGRPVPVHVHLHTQGKHVIIEPSKLRVTPTESLLSAIRNLVGDDGCEVTGAPV